MKIIRIAMISFHTCPLASEEGKETGGMNVYVLELSKELARKGYYVDMYTRCQHITNPKVVEISPNLRLIHLEAGPIKTVPKKELIKYVDEFSKNYQLFTKKNNLSYDILHCHYYLSGLIGLRVRQNNSILTPIIMSFHTLALMKNLVARDDLEKEEIERINSENLLIKTTDKIIAPSDSDMNYLQYLYETPGKKIEVIAPGVNISLFKPINRNKAKKTIGANIKDRIILFVGRIEPLKGLDMLLYAMKILIIKNSHLNTCLWIVGGDLSQKPNLWSRQMKTLKQIREFLHISMVVNFVGQKPQSQLPYYYNASELVILPSHYESFGMVALESMACGIPVITTNVAGVSSIIDSKHPSLITSVNNPLLLASQMEYLLTNKKAHMQLSKDLLKNIKNFSWENVGERVVKVYNEIL
jgi:D-inositol-3-phosphate glycosyltransferase